MKDSSSSTTSTVGCSMRASFLAVGATWIGRVGGWLTEALVAVAAGREARVCPVVAAGPSGGSIDVIGPPP